MQQNTGVSCPDCLESMIRAKGEVLARLACANCQFAENQPPSSEKLIRQPMLGMGWIVQCPDCGKWCWSRNSLALHRQLHGE